MIRFLALIAAAFLFGYSADGFSAQPKPMKSAEAKSAKIDMTNAKQQKIGEANLMETPNGVLIRVSLQQNPEGISPGTHAIHIHETGKCEPPFKSAGGHFNPSKKKHGFMDKSGKHAGDLPNIHIPENAPLTVEFLMPQLSLGAGKANLMDADGSALIIHQGADDYHTDPAGNAGDRVACGVIERASKTNK